MKTKKETYPRYWALQDKETGELVGSITGKVLVCTHRIPLEGRDYKQVELFTQEGVDKQINKMFSDEVKKRENWGYVRAR